MFKIGDLVQYNGPRRKYDTKILERGHVGTIGSKRFNSSKVWEGLWNVFFGHLNRNVVVENDHMSRVADSDYQDEEFRDSLFYTDDEDDRSREELLREQFGIDDNYDPQIKRRKRKFDDGAPTSRGRGL